MWKLTLGYDNHIEYMWEHQISKFWNLPPPPFSPQRKNLKMNYVDWKTLAHPRFFITFENKKWTTLIRIMYYGMDLIRLVSLRNATSNLRSSFRTYFKAQMISPPRSHILIMFSIDLILKWTLTTQKMKHEDNYQSQLKKRNLEKCWNRNHYLSHKGKSLEKFWNRNDDYVSHLRT